MVAEDTLVLIQLKTEDLEEELDKRVVLMKDWELNHLNQEILELLDLETLQALELLVRQDMDTLVEVELAQQVQMEHQQEVELVELEKM